MIMPSSGTQIVLLAICVCVCTATKALEWKQWTCDELTPDLCELDVKTGSFSIRSIDIHYWRYKRSGPVSNPQIDLPIITLHGGPGWPHDYMSPLKQLACRSSSEVIFYDQAGAGKSSIDPNKSLPKHLLDAKYYSEEELPALIRHLKLDRYHVFGHSWGTILAQLFVLNSKNTSGLQSLILAGPLSDGKSYVDAQWDKEEGNLGSLPPFVQERIKSLEKDDAYEGGEYKAINNVLTTFFTLRTAPAPDCFTKAGDGLNREIYVGMQGPSEFAFSGTLGGFNVTGRLHEINIPVLLTHGKFDTMRPSIVKAMEREIKLCERKMLPHSGHIAMIDDAGLMNDLVADFVHRVETNSFTSEKTTEVDTGSVKEKSDVRKDKIVVSMHVYAVHLIMALTLGVVLGKLNWNCNKTEYRRIE